MTKEEFISKITRIMDEAIKIDRIDRIVNDMENTVNNDCLGDITKEAACIGYCEMLRKTYKEIQFIWLHLHDLRSDMDGVYVTNDFTEVPIEDQPTEEEMARSREENGDD